MTTIRKIIARGFRESGFIEVGGVPDADQLEEALDLLQRMYSSFFGNELGEQLTNANYGTAGLTNVYAKDEDQSPLISSVYVPENVRLILNINQATTLTLHPNPMDGARLAIIDNIGNLGTYNVTLNGNGRTIENAATALLNTNSVNREWFYRADLGGWTRVTDLVLDNESPLPREFDDLLTTILAIRLNPAYGAQTSQEVTEIVSRARRQFRARYRQSLQVASEDGLIRLPSNPFWSETTSSSVAFNLGRPY